MLAVGNVASRLLGLVREQVIAHDWGGSLEASAFTAAARVPTLIYDLLVGGMLSAALVPVLSAYAVKDRATFWRVASTLVSAVAVLCGLAAVVVVASAPWLSGLLAGSRPEAAPIIETSLRWIAPAVLFFGLAGLLTGVLYALERFTLPAATGALYNAGFIVAAVVLADRLGVYALAAGISFGALVQMLTLAPTAVRSGLRLRLDFRHPALRRVVVLYVPIAAGLLVSMIQVAAEPALVFRWGEEPLSWMRYATNLIQFPHGLIAMAISAAILPRLSANHAESDFAGFAATLARGLRAVLTLTLPAVVGLAVLAEPVTGLVFERGAFVAADRQAVALALHGYLLGLPFAAIDWPLNDAFDARQQTWVPAAVGVGSIGVWFAVALGLPPVAEAALPGSTGYMGLVLADSAKHLAHAAVMGVLIWRATRGAALDGVAGTAFRSGLAALVMGVAVFALDQAAVDVLQDAAVGQTTVWAVRCGVGIGVGVATYVAAAAVLRVPEVGWLWRQLANRIGASL